MTFHSRVAAFTAVLVLTTLGAATNAAAVTKTFAVELSPQVAGASKSIVYTAKITNTLSPQKQELGSVDLAVPAEWRILGTSAGSVAGDIVQLRDLNLAPGASRSVDIKVDTSAVAGAWEWTARGKQANDFRGDGNDFLLDRLRSDLSVEVEPTDAADVQCPEEPTTAGEATSCKTSVTWRGFGPINEDGTPVPNDTVDGAQAPASGTSRSAAAAAVTGVTQTSFSVTVTVTAFPSLVQNAGTLTLRLPFGTQANCELNAETSPVTALVNGPLNRAKNVSLTVDAGVALAGPSQGMCYGAPTPFATAPTKPLLTPVLVNGSPWVQGVLPDCFDGSPTASLRSVTPCTSFRGNEGGNNVTSVSVPVTHPDPMYRP